MGGFRDRRAWWRSAAGGLVVAVGLLAAGELIAWLGAEAHYLGPVRDHLAQPKQPGEQRVFLYGESTTYGAPYGPENGTDRWLEQVLRGLLPGQRVRVANFSERGRGSYELLDVLRQTLAYAPDVVVIAVGHNEFLAQSISFARAPVHRWLYGRSYLYRRAYRAVVRLMVRYAPAPPAPDGVPRGTDLRRAVLAEYRRNMEAILSLTHERRVPTVLSVPASNLLSSAPVLSAEEHPRAGGRINAAAAVAMVHQAAAGGSMNAAAVDDVLAAHAEHAEVVFWYGRWLHGHGGADAAYAQLVRARDLDAFPIRCLSEQEDALAELAHRHEAALVDLPAQFRAAAGGDPPGFNLFIDHCHPRPEGQYLIAVAIARTMAERAWLAPAREWRWEQLPRFRDCLARIALTDAQWRQPEREAIVAQLAGRPELALEMLEHPPVLADGGDPEWTALRTLARARLDGGGGAAPDHPRGAP